MNGTRATTFSQLRLQLVDADFRANALAGDGDAVGGSAATALTEPLIAISDGSIAAEQPDKQVTRLLERALEEEHEIDQLCRLVSALDKLPPKSVSVLSRYKALCRLTAASSPLIRQVAYRGLARLHEIDLRFANRARLRLWEGLQSERGLMQQRIAQLLLIC